MRIYDQMQAVGEVSPESWMKDAIERMSESLKPLMNICNQQEKDEMEEWLKENGDEFEKSIWHIAKEYV